MSSRLPNSSVPHFRTRKRVDRSKVSLVAGIALGAVSTGVGVGVAVLGGAL